MGYSIHNISMPNGAGPAYQDRLLLANILNLPFPAAAKGVGAFPGSITAGTGYTFTPTITPVGGVIQAASGPGVAPVTVAGWAGVFRAVMKVISATVAAGGSGWTTNDTVLLANGVQLTVTASAGVATSLAVTVAGALTIPGGLPTSGVPVLSASSAGVGLLVNLVWGIGSISIDDSGNYSTLPTSYTVTSVDGNGSGGALSGGSTAVSASGGSLFRQIIAGTTAGIDPGGFAPPPAFGCFAMVTPPTLDVTLQAKMNGYVSVAITPQIATNAVVAGTLDAILWA